MRILHITHLYPKSYDPLLGIAMHNQIMMLAKKGVNQIVISPIPWTPFLIKYFSNKWMEYSKVPMKDVISGIKVYYPRFLSFPKAFLLASSGVRLYYGIRRLVRQIKQEFDFDIIHAHMALPDGYAAMLLSIEHRKPLVLTLQATDLDITAHRGVREFTALQKVFSYARCVISPTPRLATQLMNQFGIKSKVVGYGVDPGSIVVPRRELINRYRQHHILLSVSRLIRTKGIDLNILAIKQLIDKYKNLVYLIVGDGPERDNLKSLSHDLHVTEYVEFVGRVPHKKVLEFMSICDIFTMPSWQETFGLVYFEAMMHAKPIIAVIGQGVDGIVEHGKTGLLVKPRDVDSLVEALDFLLSHPEEARAMGKRAQKLVLENYTWEKNAEKTIEVYKEVLDGR